MGDSGFAFQLSLLVLFLIITAFVVFVIAWRVHNRVFRVLVGFFLLAMAATCSLFSTMAFLLISMLGVVAMVLGTKTTRDKRSGTQMKKDVNSGNLTMG